MLAIPVDVFRRANQPATVYTRKCDVELTCRDVGRRFASSGRLYFQRQQSQYELSKKKDFTNNKRKRMLDLVAFMYYMTRTRYVLTRKMRRPLCYGGHQGKRGKLRILLGK